ncbi:MAG: CsgG/HfaB family protein [Desulfuromonadales bacterium]|nr:CsgG/HfaB family protein [Desulfuromonadales bacterium]
MKNTKLFLWLVSLMLLSGCATVSTPLKEIESPISKSDQVTAQQLIAQHPATKNYKRKVAIARFSNESNYGRSLMTDQDYDRIGKQASDMLATQLITTNNFIVFERTDLSKIQREQAISGDAELIGVDALIVGSVTEFGRSTGGTTGFLSKTKVQTARAKVDARLVDVKTGQAFFSASGVGEASTESGEVAGFGSRAAYDATLNDRAISAAISDMLDSLVSSLDARPWQTDILEIQGNQVFISGGQRQGLKVGDTLQIMERGKAIKSQQTGFVINLPSTKVAEITVSAFFGDSANNEGSVCTLTSGSLAHKSYQNLYVEEVK